jgi:hypothetical protein
MGSVTEAVQRRATVPVVVFPVRGWLAEKPAQTAEADPKR